VGVYVCVKRGLEGFGTWDVKEHTRESGEESARWSGGVGVFCVCESVHTKEHKKENPEKQAPGEVRPGEEGPKKKKKKKDQRRRRRRTKEEEQHTHENQEKRARGGREACMRCECERACK
jgi:hypothetical protein